MEYLMILASFILVFFTPHDASWVDPNKEWGQRVDEWCKQQIAEARKGA